MRLMDILRSFIGEPDTALASLKGFETSTDTNGVNFYLQLQVLKALREGKGNALQKVQLIALNMLVEQGVAEPTANGFHIAAEDVSGMDEEQAEILRLPPRFQGRFISAISGRTGNSSFRVSLMVQMPDGSTPTPFQRKGPYLYLTSSEYYWLKPSELMGLQAYEHHCSLLPEQRGEAANLRLMAELQTAARSGMNIDLSHFERLDVVVPEHIGVVATRLPDGSLQLCPSLSEGSTPDQLEKRWSQLEVAADGGVMRIDNRVVLLDKPKMESIRHVLSNKRIPADKVAEFITTPTAFLDAALVNLEVGFSVRVIGVGKLKHMDFGTVDASRNDWFALDKRAAAPEVIVKLVQSSEDLQRLEEVLQSAIEQGASSLSFAGETIDISDAAKVRQQLEIAKESLHDAPCPPDDKGGSHEPDAPKEKIAVILKESNDIRSTLLSKANAAQLATEPNWSAIARQPFTHQQEGIEWMLRLMNAALLEERDDLYRLQGALLADDMGLGKTYMSLVAVGEYLAEQGAAGKPQKPILVVAPLSLLENWEDEVQKTFKGIPFRDVVVLQSGRDLNSYRVKGSERESAQLAGLVDDSLLDEQSIRYALTIGPEAGAHRLDMDRRLVLTTYQTLRDYQFSLCRIDWGMVIFDEAQNIKNPNALQTRAAKGLKADFKLLATGTPVENSLGDFWCLMDTAQPGLLGSWEVFRDTWIKPILAASDDERDAVRTELGRKLRDAVGIFMLRRVKEDQLKGLPIKTIRSGVHNEQSGTQLHATELGVSMCGVQLQAYDQVLNDYRSRSASDEGARGMALTALSELRAISLHPRLNQEAELYSQNGKQARQFMMESGKLIVTLKLLDEIKAKGEKVILFMMTKRLQRLLKLWLDQIYDLDIAVINGDTKAVSTKSEDMTRKSLIAAFEARKGFNIAIMSPIAAGVGLTVVGANHVIHLERHWNPAKEAQASDRVYRIGQTKNVFIHLPAVTHPEFDSFDVHLDRLLRGKLMLKDAVVTPEAVSEGEMMSSLGF